MKYVNLNRIVEEFQLVQLNWGWVYTYLFILSVQLTCTFLLFLPLLFVLLFSRLKEFHFFVVVLLSHSFHASERMLNNHKTASVKQINEQEIFFLFWNDVNRRGNMRLSCDVFKHMDNDVNARVHNRMDFSLFGSFFFLFFSIRFFPFSFSVILLCGIDWNHTSDEYSVLEEHFVSNDLV